MVGRFPRNRQSEKLGRTFWDIVEARWRSLSKLGKVGVLVGGISAATCGFVYNEGEQAWEKFCSPNNKILTSQPYQKDHKADVCSGEPGLFGSLRYGFVGIEKPSNPSADLPSESGPNDE